jgi:BirA family biotin operon repressor/biotin-[acetyl-CoA-carboxylase] ligase
MLDRAALERAAARVLGKSSELHEQLASTNDRARELAAKGSPEGTLVVALEQTGGKGRLGRTWASPRGGLYLSLVLRPDEGMLKRASVSLMAGLAASEALDLVGRTATALKWPNDILLDGKKIGGVLAEITRERNDTVVVLGVGLNVDTPAESFPKEVRSIATSLRASKGKSASLEETLRHFLAHFEGHYESVRKGGGALLLSRAADRMSMLGSRVRVKLADRAIEGKASGLNATGALVVELDSGGREIVYAGDVEELRPA